MKTTTTTNDYPTLQKKKLELQRFRGQLRSGKRQRIPDLAIFLKLSPLFPPACHTAHSEKDVQPCKEEATCCTTENIIKLNFFKKGVPVVAQW